MMITKENSAKKLEETRNQNKHVFNGTFQDIELLNSDIVKVSKLGCQMSPELVLLIERSLSACTVKENTSTKGARRSWSQKKCLEKFFKKVAKHCAGLVLVVGTNSDKSIIGSWLSYPRYCEAVTGVLAVHKGRIVFGRRLIYQLEGFGLNSRLEFHINEKKATTKKNTSLTKEEAEEKARDESVDGNGNLVVEAFELKHSFKEETPLRTVCHLLREIPESTLGWPLRRRRKGSTGQKSRDDLSDSEPSLSVVQWVMSLPNRSIQIIQKNQRGIEAVKSFEREVDVSMLMEQDTEIASSSSQTTPTFEDDSVDCSMNSKFENSSSTSTSFPLKDLKPQSMPGWPLLQISALKTQRETKDTDSSVVDWATSLPSQSTSTTTQAQISLDLDNIGTNPSMELELLLKIKSSGCRFFTYEELKSATSEFSSENMIGEGGCSSVYKGSLPCGKPVAVKILKSYKEAWNDFILEVDIVSSLNHKYITSLIGVCFEDSHIISVHNFLPKGSLDDHLHGNNRKKAVLPWDVRFKAAVLVAEALNYLHNECSPPVIHRDVKSSNILLSNEFQPQLADFGLAIWGPRDSSTYMLNSDVVGTFGYIAPEYFMHGRVSDKIDVYSFGVVLLELLSSRRPIDTNSVKGQESLVNWAKKLIDSGKLKALVDPKLDGNFDIAQMHRMVLAASLCISPSARLRPKVSQILQLLKEEKNTEEWVKSHFNSLKESGEQEDDEMCPEFSASRHLDFSLLDSDSVITSLSSREGIKLKDYLNEPQQ